VHLWHRGKVLLAILPAGEGGQYRDRRRANANASQASERRAAYPVDLAFERAACHGGDLNTGVIGLVLPGLNDEHLGVGVLGHANG